MSNHFAFEVWPDERTVPGVWPDLTDMGERLLLTNPERLKLTLLSKASGLTSVLVAISWRPDISAHETRDSLRRALVRLEGDAGFQLIWHNAPEIDVAEWKYLQPRATQLHLPSGKTIALNFPLANTAKDLFRSAPCRNFEMMYFIDFLRIAARPDLVRPLIPAFAEIQQSNLRHSSLAGILDEIFSISRHGGWLASEAFGLSSRTPEHAIWIEEQVERSFSKLTPGLGRDLIELEWSDSLRNQEQLTFIDEIWALRESDYPLRAMNAIGDDAAPRRRIVALPKSRSLAGTTFGACEPYVFLSYAHKNATFVELVTNMLKALKVNCWLDTRLQSGVVWDETLEEKIENCEIFIACVSEDYQNSKYCRRELKFADLLGKPIMPVSAEPIFWGAGLRLMFQELQIHEVRGGGDWKHIEERIRQVGPAVFSLPKH